MLDQQQQVEFSMLWADAQPAVGAYVRAIVRDSDVAKDIVQNVAVVLLDKFALWDPGREFLPWALGFAKFEILAHRRDSARQRVVFNAELLDSITEMWATVASEIAPEHAALDECLKKLPPNSREIVHLRYFEDRTMPDVADRVGSTPGAERVVLVRIRHQLLRCVHRQRGTFGGK